MNIVIIGSGAAGLTAGAWLAQAGHKVTVFEQYHRMGGVTGSFEAEGYHWDLGQLMIEGLGPGEPGGKILAELGLSEQIKMLANDRGYVFPDFEIRKPAQFGGADWRMRRLKEIFPQEAAGLDRYWKDYLRFTRLMTLARQLDGAQGFSSLWLKIRLYLTLLPFLPKKDWSAQRLMDDYFQSQPLKCVFMSILADFFTPPTQFQGLGVFALNPESVYDVRSPREIAPGAEQIYQYSLIGGVSHLMDALANKILAHGGQIFTSRAVEKILVENNHVTGVIDSAGQTTLADVVVASGGAKETFLKRVGAEHLPAEFVKQIKSIHLMDSVFMVHLGLDMNPLEYTLGQCTYYYGTYDIEGGIQEAWDGMYHEGKAGFVVHVPTQHSPQMAPAGHHALTIYTICPDRLKNGTWADQKEAFADKLVEYAEKYIPGLREHTCVRRIFTAEDFRTMTGVDHHAFGGIAPFLNAWKAPHRTPIDGLWFIGHQSESGGGVTAVMTSSYNVAKKIHAGA